MGAEIGGSVFPRRCAVGQQAIIEMEYGKQRLLALAVREIVPGIIDAVIMDPIAAHLPTTGMGKR